MAHDDWSEYPAADALMSAAIENKAGRSKRGKSIKAEPASYTAGSWGVGLRFRTERGNHSAVGAHTHHWFLL